MRWCTIALLVIVLASVCEGHGSKSAKANKSGKASKSGSGKSEKAEEGCPANLRTIPAKDTTPRGWRMATKADIEKQFEDAKRCINKYGDWAIVHIVGGQFMGKGYNYNRKMVVGRPSTSILIKDDSKSSSKSSKSNKSTKSGKDAKSGSGKSEKSGSGKSEKSGSGKSEKSGKAEAGCPANLRTMPARDPTPKGWTIATKADIEKQFEDAKRCINKYGDWAIVHIVGGQFMGKGYNYNRKMVVGRPSTKILIKDDSKSSSKSTKSGKDAKSGSGKSEKSSKSAAENKRCISSCKDKKSGNYQSCHSCNEFIQCAHGRLFKTACPASRSGKLVWDDIKKNCDYKSTTCGQKDSKSSKSSKSTKSTKSNKSAEECKDTLPGCSLMKSMCTRSTTVPNLCKKTCGKCVAATVTKKPCVDKLGASKCGYLLKKMSSACYRKTWFMAKYCASTCKMCASAQDDGECPRGYEEKYGFCIDKNECRVNGKWSNRECPRKSTCSNKFGGYTCKCYRGSQEGVSADGRPTCKAENICKAQGDPHFYTFDGEKINFQGICEYDMAKVCDLSDKKLKVFEITNKNERRYGKTKVAYLEYVKVKVYGFTIVLHKGKKLEVDGVTKSLPWTPNAEVQVKLIGDGISVTTDFGLKVIFDGNQRAYINIPDEYKSKMCGICGNFDDNAANDMITAGGKTVKDNSEGHAAIGNSWQIHGKDRCALALPHDPLENCDPLIKSTAQTKCNLLTSPFGPFRQCKATDTFKPADYVQACMEDLCANPKSDCDIYENFVDDCTKQDAIPMFVWRTADFCPKKCGANSHYNSKMASEPNTCAEPFAAAESPSSMEGCECDDGYVMSGTECVLKDSCGCLRNGEYFELGASWTDGDCGAEFVCQMGNKMVNQKIECHTDANAACRVVDGEKGCFCKEGFTMSAGSNKCEVKIGKPVVEEGDKPVEDITEINPEVIEEEAEKLPLPVVDVVPVPEPEVPEQQPEPELPVPQPEPEVPEQQPEPEVGEQQPEPELPEPQPEPEVPEQQPEPEVAAPPPRRPPPPMMSDDMPPRPSEDPEDKDDKYFQTLVQPRPKAKPEPLGMDSGLIPDGSISASTFGPKSEPSSVRPMTPGAWVPENSDRRRPYVQIDLEEPTAVHGLGTLGHPSEECWVDSYTVETSLDGVSFRPLVEKDTPRPRARIFSGNKDQNTWKRHCLHQYYGEPVQAKVLRFYPKGSHNKICMRAELYGFINPENPTFMDLIKEKDVWSKTPSGCPCYFDQSDKTCACCEEGGCQCSRSHKSQCVQCGNSDQCGKPTTTDTQVDAWTKTPGGCPCADGSGDDCACCADHACQCGAKRPDQCVDCGHMDTCGKIPLQPEDQCVPKSCP